eukprot:CAMPEP_0172509242 /NCGR_PEP_ID=MMETSP1066-20121228/218634_1 /TAXON_ID=671091 /ORGANISM="Coscinodiscus wailesii, Strain CCMP2513" /LENGTH=365 /DNA_ID=CAMNT_0013287627 /DNA_START=135 /DNA_END=1232 /DNA_ORIENTATION=+
MPLVPGTTVEKIKTKLTSTVDPLAQMKSHDIKILYKGKILADPSHDLYNDNLPQHTNRKKPIVIRLIATGLSSTEAMQRNATFQTNFHNAARNIRDDLSDAGRRDALRRKRMGQRTLAAAAARSTQQIGVATASNRKYGFERIETLPNLPEEGHARAILDELANDPGILACMTKHEWSVGCLAELYPKGNVGQTDVCVMGLNQNKGQKILLRLRTDDLKGFRKILSIRKVLYHELAHNVYSDHDNNFFRLMRKVERECNEMDWTNGIGKSVGGTDGPYCAEVNNFDSDMNVCFEGGSGRLGSKTSDRNVPLRELTARAAMMRLSAEEKDIQRHCGCGGAGNVILPPGEKVMEDDEENEGGAVKHS